MPFSWETATVSYHEAFWLATGAAAPVIALAAVAAGPEVWNAQWEVIGALLPPRRLSHWPSMMNLGNIIAQAAVLLIALVSLATGRDWTPAWLPIALSVGGVLALALSLQVTAKRRMTLRMMDLMHKLYPETERPADPKS